MIARNRAASMAGRAIRASQAGITSPVYERPGDEPQPDDANGADRPSGGQCRRSAALAIGIREVCGAGGRRARAA